VDKYDILKPLTQNNGCIRGIGMEYECDNRVYDEGNISIYSYEIHNNNNIH